MRDIDYKKDNKPTEDVGVHFASDTNQIISELKNAILSYNRSLENYKNEDDEGRDLGDTRQLIKAIDAATKQIVYVDVGVEANKVILQRYRDDDKYSLKNSEDTQKYEQNIQGMALFFRPKFTNTSQDVSIQVTTLSVVPLRDKSGQKIDIGKLQKDFLYMIIFDKSVASDPHFRLLETPGQQVSSLARTELYHNVVTLQCNSSYTLDQLKTFYVNTSNDYNWGINFDNYSFEALAYFLQNKDKYILLISTHEDKNLKYTELEDEMSIQFEYKGNYYDFFEDIEAEADDREFYEKTAGDFKEFSEYVNHNYGIANFLGKSTGNNLFVRIDDLPTKQILKWNPDYSFGKLLSDTEKTNMKAFTYLQVGYIYRITYDKQNDYFRLNLISAGDATLVASKDAPYYQNYGQPGSNLIAGPQEFAAKKKGLFYAPLRRYRYQIPTYDVTTKNFYPTGQKLYTELGNYAPTTSFSSTPSFSTDNTGVKIFRCSLNYYYNYFHSTNNITSTLNGIVFYIPYLETINNNSNVLSYNITVNQYSRADNTGYYLTDRNSCYGNQDTQSLDTTGFSLRLTKDDNSGFLTNVIVENVTTQRLENVVVKKDEFGFALFDISLENIQYSSALNDNFVVTYIVNYQETYYSKSIFFKTTGYNDFDTQAANLMSDIRAGKGFLVNFMQKSSKSNTIVLSSINWEIKFLN